MKRFVFALLTLVVVMLATAAILFANPADKYRDPGFGGVEAESDYYFRSPWFGWVKPRQNPPGGENTAFPYTFPLTF